MRLFVKAVILIVSQTALHFAASEDLFRDVVLRFYHGTTVHTFTELKFNEATKLLQHPSFDINHLTVIYIHGWNEKMNEAKTLLVIVESYLSRKNHNILALNYETLSGKFYSLVVENGKELGRRLANALRNLYNDGLNPNRVHLIGFSLGAHICAEVRRALQPYYTVPRITGFDPAYPMYYGTGNYVELNRNDAKFVDIIHTDRGIIGGPRSSGHADFYPNGGRRPQPRCGSAFWQFFSLAVGDHCAHDSSVFYYAQSVTALNPIFIATNKLNPHDTTQMAYNCSNTAVGDYILKTDD